MAVYRDFDYDLRINGTLMVTGNVLFPSSNLTVGGTISGNSFIGDGSLLKNLPIPVATSTATNGSTDPISSDWAYDHSVGTGIGKHIPSGGTTSTFLRGDGTWATVVTTDTNNYLTGVTGSGNGNVTFTVSGKPNIVWNASHTHPEFMKELDESQVLGNGFTVKGAIYAGSNGTYGNTAGAIYVRDASGNPIIQISGDDAQKVSSAKIYFDGVDGGASFSGTVGINALTVTSTGMVTNLNAEMVGGIKGADVGRKETAYEIGGYGVYYGFLAKQSGVGSKTQFTIESGVAYTKSGKRVSYAGGDYVLSSPSTTANSHRIDSIYVAGPSEGNNEGTIRHVQGAYSVTPTAPAIPSDGIKLAEIYMGSNQGSILNAQITDKRDWKPVSFSAYGDNKLFIRDLKIDTITSDGKNSIAFEKPIKGSGFAKSIIIPSGSLSSTWTHNLSLGTSYAIMFSTNSPEPHVYWSGKTTSSITINLDDVCESDITIDVVIIAY